MLRGAQMFRLRKPGARLLRRFLPGSWFGQIKEGVERIIGPEYLRMVRPGLDDLPPATLPEGFRWKHGPEGRGEDYVRVMRRSLVDTADGEWFGNTFARDPAYDPADLFVVCRGEEPVGAAAAWRRRWSGRSDGTVHMVGVVPECRGRGVGRALVLAALHRLRDKGFRDALLLTEDHRTQALRLYLSLGFRPVMVHWTHRLRWRRALTRVAELRAKH